ncbi:hypothetical protein DY000_02011496 [Brassica cretica]|uniref:Uncharacterized protein n=1 Tax=Brassica cretica TaxID=69181 RepID=A0ABQ7DAR2_BRACR|nr:hypothetical protein DY000_02011496 [Brassica cretica]
MLLDATRFYSLGLQALGIQVNGAAGQELSKIFTFLFLDQIVWIGSDLCHRLVKQESVNEIVMESKYGKKKSSSSTSSLFYEAPLGYSIEDVRPNGGIKKFKSLSTPTALRGHPEL